jgi:hypothetical protein
MSPLQKDAGIAKGYYRVSFALMHQVDCPNHGAVLFLADGRGRLVGHCQDFRGMDHLDPMVTETA